MKLFKNDKKTSKDMKTVFEHAEKYFIGQKLANEAISYRNLGEYKKAYTLLMEAYRNYNYLPAINLIGTTAIAKGDIDGAIQWYEINIKEYQSQDIFLLEWYTNLVFLYSQYKQNWKRSKEILDIVLNSKMVCGSTTNENEELLYDLYRCGSIVYLNCSEPYKAFYYANKALAINFNCQDAKNVIKYIWNKVKDVEY